LGNILITGGAGFVGSHLAEALLKLEHNVIAIDNYSTGSYQNIKHLSLPVRNKDICKFDSDLTQFDTVFHLAAQPFSKAKTNWFSESNSIFQTNVYGTYNILKHISPTCHFIAASSASVYGEGTKLFETLLYNPLSAYGYSKTLMEQVIINSPHHNYTILRPGTIIGPRGRCFPNRLIWTSIHNKPCELFDNGNITRDIIDVRDVVAALIRIMDTKTYGIFNLGTNTSITGLQLKETYKPVATTFNLFPQITTTPFTPKDFVKNSTLNSNKLYTTLNWRPIHNLTDSLTKITDDYLLNKTREPKSWESL